MLSFRMAAAIALLLAPFAWADEAADRSAIERTIAALNAGLAKADTAPLSELFADGDDNGFDVLVSLSSAQPLSEVTTPRFAVQKIQFVLHWWMPEPRNTVPCYWAGHCNSFS